MDAGPVLSARTAAAAATQAAASPAAAARAARLPSTTGTVGTPFSLSPSTSFRSIRISRCRMPQNSAAHRPATAASAPGPCKSRQLSPAIPAAQDSVSSLTEQLETLMKAVCSRCKPRPRQPAVGKREGTLLVLSGHSRGMKAVCPAQHSTEVHSATAVLKPHQQIVVESWSNGP